MKRMLTAATKHVSARLSMVSMNFVLIGFALLAVVSSKVCLHGGRQVSFFCSSSVGFQAPGQHRTVLIGLRLVEIREQVTRL